MSAPERSTPAGRAAVQIADCRADVLEIAALRNSGARLETGIAALGVVPPPCGQAAAGTQLVCVTVRPERWLFLLPPLAPGEAAARWRDALRGIAAVVDLSSALETLVLSGPAARPTLVRGCRLDLATEVFARGCAAATVIAQVSVTLVALRSGLLLLTPTSTARHLREWLGGAGASFGFETAPDVTVGSVCGECCA